MMASQLLPGAITTNSWTPNLPMTCRSENIRVTFLKPLHFHTSPHQGQRLYYTQQGCFISWQQQLQTGGGESYVRNYTAVGNTLNVLFIGWGGVLRASTGHFVRKATVFRHLKAKHFQHYFMKLQQLHCWHAVGSHRNFNTMKRRLAHHLTRWWARGGKSLFSHRRFWTAKGTSSGEKVEYFIIYLFI